VRGQDEIQPAQAEQAQGLRDDRGRELASKEEPTAGPSAQAQELPKHCDHEHVRRDRRSVLG